MSNSVESHPPAWRRPLRALLAAATISTALVGLWLVWVLTAVLPMLGIATTGGDFEGYILLVGGPIGGHGLAAPDYAVFTARGARRASGGGGRRGTDR